MVEIECKNNKLIKDRILSSLDKNYIDDEVKNLSLKNLINYMYDMDILEETLNKSNINFIINIEFIEGGFNFKTNDFSFNMDR